MPNQITAAGLQVKSVSEIITDLAAKLRDVYGPDINLDQNSPDGQLLNIFAQAQADNLELAVLVYASFALESAFGSSLDRLVALNGIARKAGSYTILPVDITVDRAVTLQGLDGDAANPNGAGFTISDGAGNQYILLNSHAFSIAGSASLAFRAKNVGLVQAALNTVVNQVTITLGVTVVNNSAVASVVGENEESDAELKIRHAKSLQLGAVGPSDAIESALLSTPGVTDAFVPENDTASTANGITARSIWAIVEGGVDLDVATAIYTKKAPGVGMVGGTTINVPRPDGSNFAAKFDRPISEPLYIKFSLLPKTTSAVFDNTSIKAQLATAISYKLNQQATIGDVYAALAIITPQGIPTAVGVSTDGITYYDNVVPATYQKKFTVSVANISIV